MKMSFQTCGLARDSSSSKIQEEDFRQAIIPDFPQEASQQSSKITCFAYFAALLLQTSPFELRTSKKHMLFLLSHVVVDFLSIINLGIQLSAQ